MTAHEGTGWPRRERRRLPATMALAVVFTTVPPTALAQDAAAPASILPAAVGPVPATSQGKGAPPAAPATFVIEKIVVEGVRHGSDRIVAAETLLSLGNAYTEAQLQEALHRVERLPFVLQADFSLRRGSERGRFELVVTVTETRPLFLGGNFELVREAGCCFHEEWFLAGVPEIGARVFFGGQSEIRAGLNGFSSSGPDRTQLFFNIAYTHHNLLDRHVVGTVRLAQKASRTGREAGVQLAFPLNPTNVLKAEALWDRAGSGGSFGFEYRSDGSRYALAWQRDTTDDPFTPRAGERREATVAYRTSRFRSTTPWGFGGPSVAPEPVTMSGEGDGIEGALRASRYWPLSRGYSVGIGASVQGSLANQAGTTTRRDSVVPTDSDYRNAEGLVTVELLRTFPERRIRRPGATQFWWKVAASLSDRWYQTDFDSPRPLTPDGVQVGGFDYRTRYGELSASVAARGRWGTVILTFDYRHYFTDRQELR